MLTLDLSLCRTPSYSQIRIGYVREKISRAICDDDHVRLGDTLQARREVRRFADDVALLRLTRSDQVTENPRRWVVERLFAWIGRNRRPAKDFEATIDSARAFLYAASVMLLMRRIARAS